MKKCSVDHLNGFNQLLPRILREVKYVCCSDPYTGYASYNYREIYSAHSWQHQLNPFRFNVKHVKEHNPEPLLIENYFLSLQSYFTTSDLEGGLVLNCDAKVSTFCILYKHLVHFVYA